MSLFPALIKALNLAVFINICIMLAIYGQALARTWFATKRPFASKLILGIMVMGLAVALLYGNTTYVYWHRDFEPMVSIASPWMRISYLVLTLLGSTMHICARYQRFSSFWRATACWCFWLGVGIALTTWLELR